MWQAVSTELAGWREALTTRGVVAGFFLRALAAIALVAVGVLGASRPVLTLALTGAGVILYMLVRLRLLGRL